MIPAPLFRDRADAGQQLAEAVIQQLTEIDPDLKRMKPIVYALPRGGLPIAAPLAQRLGCPLDIIVAKKITRPENPELALGAVTADGEVLWGRQRLLRYQVRKTAQQEAQAKAQGQWSQMASACPQVDPTGALALVVDDGIATGMTMAVAVQALQQRNLAQIWICVPVAPEELVDEISRWCDRLLVLATPHPFMSVSRFYEAFPQVEMSEAIAYLSGQ
ncbi:phosphoribosyltransferase [Laspinema sp. D1]|uniref:phosphoribosyltransferase n=1 Tax=Laspinema palackyanum TaxID=3231601 RepID=UPI0034709EE2|nr:phosphoribosyltransferase [Laspinema sp. D2b]